MNVSDWKKVLISVAMASWPLWTQAADVDVPTWLGGKPDVVMKEDRCHLYEWFLDEADSQTGGRASSERLARKRVINAANKLAEHHQSVGLETYSANIRYLVLGSGQPSHFSISIDKELVNKLLDQSCSE